MRHPHILSRNERTVTPSRFFTYDCETKTSIFDKEVRETSIGAIELSSKKHVLELGVCRYWQNVDYAITSDECVFHTVNEFWKFVFSHMTKSKTRYYLFSHNQHFDAPIADMFHVLPRNNFELKKQIIDSNIFICEWKHRETGAVLYCIDTLNIFKASLEELGKAVGLQKGLPMADGTTQHFDMDRYLSGGYSIEETTRYCQRDVEITEKILLSYFDFIHKNDLGLFAPTIAGQAKNAFRHRFMHHEIFIHSEEKAIDLERESYHGGRTEAFFIGSINNAVHCLDFNSLYPSVMLGNKYPVELISYRLYNSVSSLKELMNEYLVIAECTIDIKEPCMAIKKDELFFPIGRVNGVFCSPELEYLFSIDAIKSVGRVACYRGEEIFTDYVNFFYNDRLEAKARGDTASALMDKYFMNSLYGKFGQRTRENVEIGDWESDNCFVMRCHDRESDEYYTIKGIGGKYYECSTKLEESRDSFPAIASFCTSYARMKLWYAMVQAGLENVYYSDTDSLFVNDTGRDRLASLTDNDKLGLMKLEYSSPLGMHINTLKDYVVYINDPKMGVTRKTIKIKGINKNARQISENEYVVTNFRKIPTSTHKNTLDCVMETESIKRLSREYKKGIIMPDGRVKPMKFEDKNVGGELE